MHVAFSTQALLCAGISRYKQNADVRHPQVFETLQRAWSHSTSPIEFPEWRMSDCFCDTCSNLSTGARAVASHCNHIP